jgi:hypothetical protein
MIKPEPYTINRGGEERNLAARDISDVGHQRGVVGGRAEERHDAIEQDRHPHCQGDGCRKARKAAVKPQAKSRSDEKRLARAGAIGERPIRYWLTWPQGAGCHHVDSADQMI